MTGFDTSPIQANWLPGFWFSHVAIGVREDPLPVKPTCAVCGVAFIACQPEPKPANLTFRNTVVQRENGPTRPLSEPGKIPLSWHCARLARPGGQSGAQRDSGRRRQQWGEVGALRWFDPPDGLGPRWPGPWFGRAHSLSLLSMITVTGPSFVRVTSMCAPNRPVGTGLPRSASS